MKRFFHGSVAVAVMGTALLSASVARAQDAPIATTTADAAAQPEVKADWTTFGKAIGAVYGSASFGYDADTDIAITSKGVSVKGKQKTKFVAQRPGKVRSETQMSLGDDLKDARKYIAITDGTTYWVNRLDKPRYSATPVSKVDLTKELNAMGVLGVLYLNRDLMGGLSSLTDESAEALLPTFESYGLKLTKGVEPLNDSRVPTYNLNLTALKINIKFFLDSVGSNISRVELTAKDVEKGMDFKVMERITKLDRQPTVTESLFVFTPPAGLEKSEKRIPVDLFEE